MRDPKSAENVVVDFADADDAVRGSDYRVVDRNHRTSTDTDDKAIGYSAFTPDGTALGWVPCDCQLLEIDLSTLDRDLLSAPPERPDSVTMPIYVGTDKIVFRDENWDGSLTYDRETHRWDKQAWFGLPFDSRAVHFALGSDDRLYLGLYASDPDGPPSGTHNLWSVDLRNPIDVRDERIQVGSIARVGGSLVWTDPTAEKSPYLHVRDLATGDTRRIDTGGASSSMTVVTSSNHEVILTQSKRADGDRVTAYSTDGTRALAVTGGDRVLAGGVNDTHVLVYGKDATYTAELDTGRLLKVSDETTFGTSFLGGSYVFWQEPTPDTSVIQVVAEML